MNVNPISPESIKNADFYVCTFLVVLYGCCIEDSISIRSLCSAIKKSKFISNLIIFNNGPCSLEFNVSSIEFPNGGNVEFRQDVRNLPLSKIYNKFAPQNGVYIILDQDTNVSDDYIAAIDSFLKSDAGVFLPRLKHGNKIIYPYSKSVDLKEGEQQIVKIVSATSGIALKKCVLNAVSRVYGNVFDERFAFYGIDVTFFLRLRRLKVCQYFIGPILEHDLSGSTPMDKIDDWRFKERAIDAFLQIRNYPELGRIFSLLIFFYRSPKVRLLKILPEMIPTIVTGIHPRSREFSSC